MKKIAVFTALGGVALALSACDVEQTEEAELPEVNVETSGGNMPEYDVDTADVELKTEERTVEVPVIETEPADADAE